MNKKKVSLPERYLTKEIGIEFKACLYFFCILFFYCVYRVIGGSLHASIIHMTEMILLTYGMGYVQVYLLSDFDEAECWRMREIFYMLLCSLLYTGISLLGRWFDRNPGVTIGFALYMMLAYVCAFLVYKAKRDIDAKLLNEDLKAFQERRIEDEERDRDS
ncbi:MAG: DUF3021 domain-containing protein [Lachnospiraceae bacterium]|nr:DUF3021 domain-containing protein [Lachnospiraceae bacterium]